MYACVPMLLCPAGLAKPEIGPSQTRGLYIPFSFLLHYLSTYHSSSVFLSPLLSLIPPNLPSHPFSLSISFSFHTLLIFFNNIVNPTLHFLSPFFLPRPHYLFFRLSHFQPHTYFSKFFQSFEKLHCVSSLIQTRHSPATVFWLTAQLTMHCFSLCHLAKFFDVSSRCSHPSVWRSTPN